MDANEGKHLTDEQIDEFCRGAAGDAAEQVVEHSMECEECSRRIDEHEAYLRALRAELQRLRDQERGSSGSMAFAAVN